MMKDCCKGVITRYCPKCGSEMIGNFNEEEKRVADIMHALYCTWNHTDGCAWYYREHDWLESTHVRYAKKAKEALLLYSADEIAHAYDIHTTLKGTL